MKTLFGRSRAICTFLLVLLAGTATYAHGSTTENLAHYKSEQLSAGAKTLPVAARVLYQEALADFLRGDLVSAEKGLVEATSYDPQFVNAYLVLTVLKLRQLDPEAAVHLIEAFTVMGRSFREQALLAVNTLVAIPFVLVVVGLIVCLAFTVKYLPFAAHRLEEFLRNRFRAAMPKLTAYLILLLPLVILPSVITILAYTTIVCWLFMYRRERFAMIALLLPFILLGFLGTYLRPLTPLADSRSLTSLIATANESAGDESLIKAIEVTPAGSLTAEKHVALGLLNQRNGAFTGAADHYFKSIAENPNNPTGYINLGNVYFLQGSFEKALEGYRKAEAIEPNDAVTQHALAQAFIKTLLMKEASRALQASAALGLEDIKASYTPGALDHIAVYPKTFSNKELWGMAIAEGKTAEFDVLDQVFFSLMRFPRGASALLLLGALIIAFALSRFIDPAKLTFQCANCGQLTCGSCCNTDRETPLCQECANSVAGVTSEKVTEALLRQKRQTVVVGRRKSSRFATMLLPGMRDISYGRISRGFRVAVIFSIGIVHLIARGSLFQDSMDFPLERSMWYMAIPAFLVLLAYIMSAVSKPQYSFKAYSQERSKGRVREIKSDFDDGVESAA